MPVLVFGALPVAIPNTPSVLLMHFPQAEVVGVDGLHFRFNTASNTRRAVIKLTNTALFRCTNCTFIDNATGAGAQTNGGGTDFFAHGAMQDRQTIWWLENNVYSSPTGNSRATDVSFGRGASLYVKNSICQGTFLRGWSSGLELAVHSNTILGIMAEAMQNSTIAIRSCEDNLVMVPPGTSMANVVPLSVPPMSSAPRFDGASSPKDPYRGFRLKKGQPAATMARDGGPIGARVEYLPEIPAEP